MTKQIRSTSPKAAADTIPRLRTLLDGRVITPEDATYDEARSVFYGSRSRRPALVVRAARIQADATAFAHRERRIMVALEAWPKRSHELAA